MSCKELAGICECTWYVLRKRLMATAAVPKYKAAFSTLDFTRNGPKTLTKKQVKLFLEHNDIIPETLTVN